MSKKIYLAWLFTLSILAANSQVTTDPEFPVINNSIKIIFDASQGTAGLKDCTGDVYAHTGVITDKSTSGSDWKYVIASWNTNVPKAKMTRTSANIYELQVTPNITDYYGVPSSEKILKMAFVFRSADGSREGKASGGTDIFVDVYEEGPVVEITEPSGSSILEMNEAISFIARSSVNADLKLCLDENMLAQNTGTQITTDYTFTAGGNYSLIAEATAGGVTVFDSMEIFVRNEVTIEPLPTGYKKGINYIDDNTAALVLYAPLKESVFVIGDFNDWKLQSEYQMKKDSDTFWLEIPNLQKGKEYIFQYLIDGELKIADPYTEKIVDPWNDQYIPASVYPGLLSYPTGKTEGIAAVLQTGQESYNWQIDDFEMPDKNKMVIYELLVRDFTSEHSYQAVIDKLDYLEDLRINVLELMPVNEFEGNSSWGYNPSFYFAPDKYYGPKNKLKELIDECHQRGIAVVFDMVLNHSYGQSPFVQMYWNSSKNQPSAENPWYNEEHNFQNPDAQWGYDFNHESLYTKELVDSINSFWMSEYKVDGFRFDFTKGFSNTSWNSSSWGSSYDASRIANLKRMSDEIWKQKSNALIIFEHLSDNSEEKELANYGILLWGNMNYDYAEAAMGYSSNFSWGVYSNRGWSQPNLVTYMESHDEQRLMYKNLQYGNSSGNYSIKQLSVALDRIELNSVFYIPIPGPKMIWQFGERGYDISIDEGGRLGEKPPHWEYLEQSDRTDLYKVMAKLHELKQCYEEFAPESYSYSLNGYIKNYRLTSGENHVFAVGNFDVVPANANLTFPETGKWYEFFSRDSVEFSKSDQILNLEPGEYRLYSTRKFDDQDEITDITEVEQNEHRISVYPNPAEDILKITSNKMIDKVEVYSMTGRLIFQDNTETNTKILNVDSFEPRMYIVRTFQNKRVQNNKIIVR
ncbi:alpha-amylase family glycosyl hydrolase [Maribellus mangrovi]|uniref:alpha-amylase family glycosyl hydrolase n=1 Tax=Maribellus mangrovi TaxID=3133146 RepID=UPI0030EF2E8F